MVCTINLKKGFTMNELIRSEIKEKLNGNVIATKAQAARVLQISEATIDRMRKANKIHSIKVGNQVMFKIDELVRYLDQ